MRGLVGIVWIGVLAVGCSTLRQDLPPLATNRYEVCEDPVGRAALDAARDAIARGSYDLAVPHLVNALEACPDHVRTHLLYVDTAADADRLVRDQGGDPGFVAAMEAYYEEPRDETSPVWPYMQARLAIHDYWRLEYLEQAIERDPSFYWAYLSRGRILRALTRGPEALDSLESALAARPSFAEARLERAELLAEMGRLQESAAEYANYVRQRPSDRAALRRYSRLLIYDLEEASTAEAIVVGMLEDDPDDVDALMSMAAIDWRNGQLGRAVARYHRVLDLDPTQARAVLNLGNLYYDQIANRPSIAPREVSLARARAAYRFYLDMNRTQDRYDLWDFHLTVPYRIREIGREIGPDDGPPPTLDDF